jgi:hypothetical protein
MQRLKSPKSAQKVHFVHAAISNTFHFHRHLIPIATLRLFRSKAMDAWTNGTAAA